MLADLTLHHNMIEQVLHVGRPNNVLHVGRPNITGRTLFGRDCYPVRREQVRCIVQVIVTVRVLLDVRITQGDMVPYNVYHKHQTL